MKVQLKGLPAVLVIVVIVVGAAGKFYLERSTLESEAVERIKLQLQGEYSARELSNVDVDQLSAAELEAAAEQLMSLSDIVFTSTAARGKGDDVVVRVEISVAGKDPPDGKGVRYYVMSHSVVTGWHLERETTALSYYLKLF